MFGISLYAFFSALAETALITSRVPTIRTMEMGRQMSQLWIKPAMMKHTKEDTAL